MQFINLNFKNISVAVVDSICDDDDNECFFKIIICRNKFQELLSKLFVLLHPKKEISNPLTQRELEVLELLSQGKNNSQIAKKLSISVHTSKVHVKNILHKFSVQDRTEAVVKAIKYRILDI